MPLTSPSYIKRNDDDHLVRESERSVHSDKRRKARLTTPDGLPEAGLNSFSLTDENLPPEFQEDPHPDDCLATVTGHPHVEFNGQDNGSTSTKKSRLERRQTECLASPWVYSLIREVASTTTFNPTKLQRQLAQDYGIGLAPTPEQIANGCKEVQSKWTTTEKLMRIRADLLPQLVDFDKTTTDDHNGMLRCRRLVGPAH